MTRDNELTQLQDTCGKVSSGGYSVIVDLSWGGWTALATLADHANVPYVRMETSNRQFVQVTFQKGLVQVQASSQLIRTDKVTQGKCFLVAPFSH